MYKTFEPSVKYNEYEHFVHKKNVQAIIRIIRMHKKVNSDHRSNQNNWLYMGFICQDFKPLT
jgi:hypothetical protein